MAPEWRQRAQHCAEQVIAPTDLRKFERQRNAAQKRWLAEEMA